MYCSFGNDVRVQAVAEVYRVDVVAVRTTELARNAVKRSQETVIEIAMATQRRDSKLR